MNINIDLKKNIGDDDRKGLFRFNIGKKTDDVITEERFGNFNEYLITF